MNNISGQTRSFAGMALLSLLLAALTSGCRCTAISNHEWPGAGYAPPKISRPEDIASNLRTNVNVPIGGFSQKASFFFTSFKRMGIRGWSDLDCDGEITGVVQQVAISADQFCTVDMKLDTLQVDGRNLSLSGDRYLRAEVCLCEVKLSAGELPVVGEKIWMRGRMVWDGDGFVEIHPRTAADLSVAPVPNK